MTLPTTPAIADVPPFVYQATPQEDGKENAQAAEINNQAAEDYLNQLRIALLSDVTDLFNEVKDQHP